MATKKKTKNASRKKSKKVSSTSSKKSSKKSVEDTVPDSFRVDEINPMSGLSTSQADAEVHLTVEEMKQKKRPPKPKLTPEEAAAEEQQTVASWKVFGGLVLVVVLILGAFIGISNYINTESSAQSSYSYNAFDFQKGLCPGSSKECWHTTISTKGQPYHLTFHNGPKEVEDIYAVTGMREMLFALEHPKQIYISVDPRLDSQAVIAGTELAKITGERFGIFNIPTAGALTHIPEDGIVPENVPLADCRTSNQSTLIIKILQQNYTFVVGRDNCIEIGAATGEEAIRGANRLAYVLLGIMEPNLERREIQIEPTVNEQILAENQEQLDRLIP